MKTSTGPIKSLPDTAPQPVGSVVDGRLLVTEVVEFWKFWNRRLVWWRGAFYAVTK